MQFNPPAYIDLECIVLGENENEEGEEQQQSENVALIKKLRMNADAIEEDPQIPQAISGIG